MTVVLHVHGTGVREPAYTAGFDLFRTRVAGIRPGATITPCYWGGYHGSQLGAGGISIPEGRSFRAIGGAVATDDDIEVALWGLLDADPLFELGMLAAGGTAIAELPPNVAPPGVNLATQARRLSVRMATELSEVGLHGVFAAAVDAVLGSVEGQDALRLDAALGGELRTALARAFVAQAMLAADEELDGVLALDGEHRDTLVAVVVAELGGSDRGLKAGLGKVAGRLALRMGVMKAIERRRAAITKSTTSTAGDVLMYLARGDCIRSFICEQVRVADGPVVIVAHSLGGVAAVDLLAVADLPSVTLLVTVGTQAPLLYELNALPNLEYGKELPNTFPRWVNIYDRRDLLSFIGAGVFPSRVVDCAVDNRVPFPRSHSAYLSNNEFYDVLNEFMP